MQRRSISAYGYEQAKALIYSENGEPAEKLSLHGHSLSPAHSDRVTARMLAAPINPADINTVQGMYPSKPPFTTDLSTAKPSAVPGNEGLAEVLSAGTSATAQDGQKLQKGDWLIMKAPGVGTWRTHVQAPASSFLRLTEQDRQGISPIQAATASVNPCTAYAMLKGWIGDGSAPPDPATQLREGDWFVQNGANSGVGRAAIQLAKSWGVRSINVVRARPEGAEATEQLKNELKKLGADVVLTEDEVNEKGFSSKIKAEVLNNGRDKVRLALNCVGGRSALNVAKLLAQGSSHITYGAMAKQPLSVPAGMLIFSDLRFCGFWVSRWSAANPEEKMKAVREVFDLTRAGKFQDIPVDECKWEWKTEQDTLVKAVAGTLEGFRNGKGVFVFGET